MDDTGVAAAAGGIADEERWRSPAVLGRRLRLSVQLANPLANLRVASGALDGLVTDDVAPLLMLPIGLALRKAA